MVQAGDPNKPSGSERFVRLVVVVFLLGAIVLEAVVPFVALRWAKTPFPGLFFEHTLVVSSTRADDNQAIAALDPSLHLLAVDGQAVATARELQRLLASKPPGSPFRLTMESSDGRRDGAAPQQVDVVSRRFGARDLLRQFWLPYGVGLAYLALGIWVFGLRMPTYAGKSFALFCVFMAIGTGTLFDLVTTHLFSRIWTAALPLIAASLVHLALVFPEPVPTVVRRPWLRLAPYVAAVPLIVAAELALYSPGDPWSYVTPWRWIYAGVGLGFVVFCALTLYAHAHTVSAMVRQQVRLILLGSLLGFGPLFVYMLLAGPGTFAAVAAGIEFDLGFQPVVYLPALVLFPLFIAYAILRYKLLGMDLVVSRGLAYTVLAASAAGAYVIILSVLGQVLGSEATNHPFFLGLFAAILIMVLNPLREGSERLVDRLLSRRRLDYRRALEGFSRELVSTPLALPVLLERLLARIEPAAHSAPALILLYDPLSGRYMLQRSSNFVAAENREVSFARDSGLIRCLVHDNRPLYLLEESSHPAERCLDADERRELQELGLELFLPMRDQGGAGQRLSGLVVLGPRLSGEPYSPDDLDFLAALVDQATIAIQNARLLADLEQQVVRLDVLRGIGEAVDLRQNLDSLLDLIYRQTCRVLEVDNFYVALFDESRQEFHMAYYVEERERAEPSVASWPLGTGLTSEIVRNGQPIVTDDYLAECQRRGLRTGGRPAKAWLGVPLKGPEGRVLGVMNVSSFRSNYHYNKEQILVIQAIADQAAVAIDRMRLYRGMEVRAAQLATLYQVTQSINSTLDLRGVLDLIMNRVVGLLDVEAGSLLLVHDESGDLVFEVVVGGADPQSLAGRHHPAGKGIIGVVAASGQAQIVNDVQADPNWDRRVDRDSGFVTRRLLCVPMISRDRVAGVIEVINHRDGRPFEEEEAVLLTSFAAQAAVAIENARLYTQTDQALARRVQELSTMQRIDRDLNVVLDLKRVMDTTMEWALRATQVPVGLLAVYDEEHQGLLLLASRGCPPEADRYREEPWPLDAGIVGRVVRTGQAALVADVRLDADYRPIQPSSRSQLSVPLRREDRVLGVISLESPEAHAFDDEDLVFVQRLADHAAIAIENARLHDETQRHLRQQVALRAAGEVISSALDVQVIMSHVAEQMCRAVQVTSAYICERALHRGIYTVIAEYCSPEAAPEERVSDLGVTYRENDDSFYQRLQSEGYAIAHLDDPTLNEATRSHMAQYAARSILYIPFIVRGRLVGFAELWESRRKRRFQTDEIVLCQGISQQTAIAIENTRLYDESRRRAEEMALLYDISLTVSSYLTLDNVLEAVYSRIREVWDPPVFFIALYDARHDALDFPIYLDRGKRLEPFRLDLATNSGFSAWIVRNRHPLLIADWLKEAGDSAVHGIPLGEPTRSWLGVPLLAGDRMVGVMSVQDYAPNVFGEEHERFLSTIATEVSIAIENARLYQQAEEYARELAERAERLALINRISAAANSTLDLDEILSTATREMARAFQVKQAGMFLIDESALSARLVAEHWEGRDKPGVGLCIPLARASSLDQVLRTSQPLFVADAAHDPLTAGVRAILRRRRILSLLVVPLVVKGRVIGVVELGSVNETRTFAAEEIDLAQTIANQVGMAVENVRLYQETQRRLQEMSLLYDTSAAVSRTLDLELVLRTTAEQITAALNADGCVISTWDAEEDNLVTQLGYSLDPAAWEPETTGTVHPLAEHATRRRVLTGRQPVAMRYGDPAADAEASAWLAGLRARSALAVPLIARDKAGGLLEMVRAGSDRAFLPSEVRLCQTLANQAAAAIENARLYEGVREADQAKSEFIDFVAHELKQPMTAMQGYSKLLIMGIGGELTPNQRQFVDVINSNVDRMGKLVNDLLEISRLEAGRTKLKLAPVRLQEIVAETIANTRTEIEARQHTLQVEAPPDLPPVLADHDRLLQILTNLVSNAYKYTPKGGLIRIAIDGRDRYDVPQGYLCVSVSDTGIGMSAQDLVRLQEKFFRADHDLVQQQPGTGLGVSITRNLVALHGGELQVESEPGRGSTFSFTLPLAPVA